MQKTDKLDYKNTLNESVGLSKDSKNGSIHYFDDNKIQRWYVFEESDKKDILACAKTPEELQSKLSSIKVSNIDSFNKILKYRSTKAITESAVTDRLFYLDTLYGNNNNKLRGILKENNQLPVQEKTYEQIIQELDAYPTQPAPYPQEGGTAVATQGAPSGEVTGVVGNEMDFVLSDIFDEVLSKIKELRAGCQDSNKAHLYHHTYENMFETRKKWIESIKKRLEETAMGGQQPQQPKQGV